MRQRRPPPREPPSPPPDEDMKWPSFVEEKMTDPTKLFYDVLRGIPGIDPVRMQDRAREEKLVTFLFARVFGLLCSVALTAVFVYLFFAYGPTKNACPVWHGRTCNDQGVCTQQGICECNPAYSGLSCEESLVPGYDPVSGQVCSGRGIGAMLMLQSDVPAECQPSWYSAACRALVSQLQQTYLSFDGNVNQLNQYPQLVGFPSCFCHDSENMYSGLACEVGACPANQDGEVCSNHGNKSISLFSYSAPGTGNGCTCSQSFSLAEPAVFQKLSIERRILLQSQFPTVLGRRYCGVFVQLGTNTFFKFSGHDNLFFSQFASCVCDTTLGYTGLACNLDLCPTDSLGQVCSGNGHPSYGFGYKANTTQPTTGRGVACSVHCAPSTEKCVGTQNCLPSLASEQTQAVCSQPQICPTDTPLRCGDGTCASIPTNAMGGNAAKCALGFMVGSMDPYYLPQVRDKHRCDPTACPTDLALALNNTFVTAQSPRPFVWVLVESNGTPWANVTATTDMGTFALIPNTHSNGTIWSLSFAYTAQQLGRLRYEGTGTMVTISGTAEDLALYPCPFLDAQPPDAWMNGIRIRKQGDVFVGVQMVDLARAVQADIVAYAPTELFLVYTYEPSTTTVLGSNTLLQRTDAGYITASSCLGQITLCAFNASAVNATALLEQGYVVWSVRVSLHVVPDTMAWGTQDSSWFLPLAWEVQTLRTTNYTLSLSVPSAQVLALEVLDASSTQYACACAPPLLGTIKNRTVVDAARLAKQTTPADAWVVGTYVAFQTLLTGSTVMDRGSVLTTTGSILGDHLGVVSSVSLADAVPLTAVQYSSGVDDANIDQFPLRCPSGLAGAYASDEYTSNYNCTCTVTATTTTCACGDSTCTCGDSSCVCDSQNGLPLGSVFERNLFADVAQLRTSCGCSVADALLTNAVPSLTTVTQMQDSFVNLFPANGSVIVGLTYESSCLPTDVMLGDVSLQFDTYQLGNNMLELSLVVGNDAVAWQTATSLHIVDACGSLTTNVTLLLAPAGIPVPQDVVYTATSAVGGHPPSEAQVFEGTWWESVPGDGDPASGYSTWLQASFPATRVPRVLVDVAFGALMRTLPVQMVVETLPAGSTTWAPAGTLVSHVIRDDMGLMVERYWVSLNTTATPSQAVRIRSQYPMGIRQFVPFVDQQCVCANNVPIQSLEISTQLSDVAHVFAEQNSVELLAQAKLANVNPNATGPCVCLDDCVITVGTVSLSVANSPALAGVCSDVLNYVQTNNIQVTTTTNMTGTVISDTAPYQLLVTNTTWNSTLYVFSYTNTTSFIPQAVAWSQQVPAGIGILYNDTTISIAYLVNLTNFIWNSSILLQTTPLSGSMVHLILTQYSLTTYTEYNPPIPTEGLCETGHACTACGPSNRLATMPGMTCSLSAFEEAVIMQNVRNHTNRTISLGTLWTLHPDAQLQAVWQPRSSTSVRLISSCAQCAFPQQRCPDGTCSEQCASMYTCPGSGCVENANAPGVYSCGCGRGSAGAYCQFTYTVAADPRAGTVDPHQITTSGGPPPITQMPSAVSVLNPVGGYFSIADYVRLNYAMFPHLEGTILVLNETFLLQYGKQQYITINRDTNVRNFAMCPRFPGYGSRRLIKRTLPKSGDVVYSECPFAAKTKLGQLVLLTDCVQYDPVTLLPVSLTTFYDFQGNPYTIPWDNVTHYDEFPYRCPNGQCVSDPTECTYSASIQPPCGGNGLPLADGTCQCASGYMSFFINPTYTELFTTPYDATNPFNWYGAPVDYWRYYGGLCQARNCSQMDCSPPTGCDPGTAANNFQDADVQCSSASPRKGMCAKTQQDCVRNVGIYAPKVCRGRGIAVKVDYRDPPEYICVAGDPINPAVPIEQVTDTSQLLPNGLAGFDLGKTQCNGPTDTILQWRVVDPFTLQPYTDLGVVIPGRWTGYCGVMIGPDPDELALWQQCGCMEQRLERCTVIPCTINSELLCLDQQTCLDRGGPSAPHVYPANNHGTVYPDGTHVCSSSSSTGVVYVSDYTRFDRENCYGTAQCGISQISGTVCNRGSSNDPAAWKLHIPDLFMSDQLDVVLASLGYDMGPRTWVRTVLSPRYADELIQQTYLDAAARYGLESKGFTGCICVSSPTEDCANPIGMAPYCGNPNIGYGLTYKSPHLLNIASTSTSYWFDNVFSQYTATPNLYISPSTPSSWIYFDDYYTVTHVRIYASRSTSAVLDFVNDEYQQGVVCASTTLPDPKFNAPTSPGWYWSTVYCTTTYNSVDLSQTFPRDYTTNCGTDPSSSTCILWEKQQCSSALGGLFYDVNTLDVLPGCLIGQCCVPVNIINAGPTNKLVIQYNSGLSGGVGGVYISEVQVYGYKTKATPPPAAFTSVLTSITGYAGCAATPDYIFVAAAMSVFTQTSTFQGDKGYYLPNGNSFSNPASQSKVTWANSLGACAPTAGKIAYRTSLFDETVQTSDDYAGVSSVQVPASSELGQAMRAFGIPTGGGWIAATNTKSKKFKPPVNSDYIDNNCLTYACRHRNGDNQYHFPSIYMSRNLNAYPGVPNWWSGKLSRVESWFTYFTEYNLQSIYATAANAIDFGQSGAMSTALINQFIVGAPAVSQATMVQQSYNSILPKSPSLMQGEREYVSPTQIHCEILAYSQPNCAPTPTPNTWDGTNLGSVHVGPSQTAQGYLNSMGIDGSPGNVGFGLRMPNRFPKWNDGATHQFSGGTAATLANYRPIAAIKFKNSLNCIVCIAVDSTPGLTSRDCVTGNLQVPNGMFIGSMQDNDNGLLDNTCYDIMPYLPSAAPTFSFDNGVFAPALVMAFMPYTGFVHKRINTEAMPSTQSALTSYTRTNGLGYFTHPYMCMGVNVTYLFWIDLDSSLFWRFGQNLPHDFTASMPNILLTIPKLMQTYIANFYLTNTDHLGGLGPSSHLEGAVNYDFGTAQFSYKAQLTAGRARDYPSDLTTPVVPIDGYNWATCSSYGVIIPDCNCCELTDSVVFEADQKVASDISDLFFDQQTVGYTQTTTCGTQTQSPLLLNIGTGVYSGGTFLNIPDGLARLYTLTNRNKFGFAYAEMFAYYSVMFDVSQLGTFWYKADCLAVDPVTNILAAYPCELSLNYICQFDFTQYCAQPGMYCTPCGDGSRIGGYAHPNETCLTDFDLSYDVFGKNAYLALQQQNFSLLASQLVQELAYAAVYNAVQPQVTDAFWMVRAASDLFLQGISTLQGRTTPNTDADTTWGVDFSISQIWPFDCGNVPNIDTGIDERRLASLKAYCANTNTSGAARSLLPGVLLAYTGGDLGVAQCAEFVLHPATYFNATTEGDALPPSTYFTWYVIQSASIITGLQLLMKTSDPTYVYNTFRSELDSHFYGGSTYTIRGTASATCSITTGCAATQITIWAALVDVYGNYPATRSVLGSISVGSSVVSYSFTFTPLTTLDVVGFDINSDTGYVVTLGNVFVSTSDSEAKCRNGTWGITRVRRDPAPAVSAPVLDNMCVTTQQEQIDRGSNAVGVCSCDDTVRGVACDAPAFVSHKTTEITAFGGFGTGGRVVAPDGSVVSVSSREEDRGLFVTADGLALGKPMDPGRILWTRLTMTTLDYRVIYRVDPLYGADPFFAATVNDGLSPWNSLVYVESVLYTKKAVLPSFLNADELSEYLAVATSLPVFVDLQQVSYAVDGTSDWRWATRGSTFYECLDPTGYCGTALSDIVSCGGSYWSTEMCDVINLGISNIYYKKTNDYLSDGSWVATGTLVTSQVITLYYAGTWTVQVWWSNTNIRATLPGCTAVPLNLPAGGQVTSPKTRVSAYLGVWTCTTTVAGSTVTLSFGTSSAAIMEIQMFDSQSTLRVPFYPITA